MVPEVVAEGHASSLVETEQALTVVVEEPKSILVAALPTQSKTLMT
jgi:hypothetical protein